MEKPAISLGIPYDLENYWQKIARWARFISVVQLSLLGLGVLGFLTFGWAVMRIVPLTSFPNFASSGGFYLYGFAGTLLALLCVTGYVSYLHFNFSQALNTAIATRQQSAFEDAWLGLRRCFRIWGITVIAMIVLYMGLAIYLYMLARQALRGM